MHILREANQVANGLAKFGLSLDVLWHNFLFSSVVYFDPVSCGPDSDYVPIVVFNLFSCLFCWGWQSGPGWSFEPAAPANFFSTL